MYVYKITNLVNDKIYIGITNNPKVRWSNHRTNKKSLIGRAIQKYGRDNFRMDILFEGLTIEEAEAKEIELIAQYNATNKQIGYNITLGGRYGKKPGANVGELNPRHILTEAEVRDIKSRRNLPEYVLFEDYSDKITYRQFKCIYNDLEWKNVKPTVDPYPYNLEFSCQFTASPLDYGDIVEMRKMYADGVTPSETFKKFEHKVKLQSFGDAYRGDTFRLVMPEVFTKDKKHEILSKAHSGEANGRAKLTKEDVIEIRRRFAEGEVSDSIHKDFPQVSLTSIRSVINRKTWKNI